MPVQNTPWVHSPGWDGFWLLSGFWIPLLLLALPQHFAKPFLIGVTLCFWIAHRFSSLYLGFCVGEYQRVLQARRGYFIYAPLGILLALGAYLLAPEALIPLSVFQRFLLLGLADYFFSLYHFAVQHYGVLAVYRGRLPHGQKNQGLLRMDWWLCMGVSGLLSFCLDFFQGELASVMPFLPGLKFSLPAAQLLGIKLGFSLLLCLVWAGVLKRYRRENQGLPRMLYVSSLCFMTLVSLYLGPLLYFAVAQIQHWSVSLGLTRYMAAQSQQVPAGAWYRVWNRVNHWAWGPLLVLVGLSLLLTPFLEADLYLLHNFDPNVLTVPYFLQAFQDSVWLLIFGALAFYSSLLHYLFDRGVFRFSDPLTRESALALLAPVQKQRLEV